MLKWTFPLAALILALSPTAAMALPGQTIGEFQAWSKARPILASLKKGIIEADAGAAGPYYGTDFTTGSIRGSFGAYTLGGKSIALEMVFVRSDLIYGYDINEHLDVATALLQAVYGAGVAGDFKHAAKLGSWKETGRARTPTALYLGRIYGYELSMNALTIWPLSDVSGRLLKDRSLSS